MKKLIFMFLMTLLYPNFSNAEVKLFDQFNGWALNSSLWDKQDPKWIGDSQWGSKFLPENVIIWNGNLHLRVSSTPTGYGIGMIRSKQKFLYGTFVARIRSVYHAVSNGFWLYNNTDPNWWTEIGILEVNPAYSKDYRYGLWEHRPNPYEKIYHHNFGGWPQWGNFYHHKLVWTPTALIHYIENIPISYTPNTRWHQPLFLCLSTQVWNIGPVPSHLPLDMMVDWVGVTD